MEPLLLSSADGCGYNRVSGGELTVGDVYVEVELANYDDYVLARHGHLSEAEIRRAGVRLLVDTGAVMLVLPEDLVDVLGLTRWEKVVVTYADERREQRETAGAILVRVGDRQMVTRCIVGPPQSEPLLGQIILEELDLLVDARQGRLVPRPESPYRPSLKLKGLAGRGKRLFSVRKAASG
jgi:predicted aspartyl protease